MRKAASKSVVTRRQFTLAGALTGVAAACACHRSADNPWETFSSRHAATLASLCDQIIPADDFQSASQAGVINYIDRQLGRHYRRHLNAYRKGLDLLDAISRQRTGVAFAEASTRQQFESTVELERQAHSFFELVRQPTLEGYYGSPRYGGNRDAASWRMLGLDEPPLRGRAQYDLRRSKSSGKAGRS